MAYNTFDSTECNTVWKDILSVPEYERNRPVNAEFQEYLVQLICLHFPFCLGSRERYM